jgi:hypothetical protein
LCWPAQGAATGFEYRELEGGRLQLLENGAPVFVYNHGMQLAPGVAGQFRRSGYVYPVWTPAGTSVAGDFQKDHPMHRGMYFGWREVQELNRPGRPYDFWGLRGLRTKWLRWVEKRATPGQAILEAENGWIVDADGRQIGRERLRYVVEPPKDGRRVISVTGTFEAQNDPITIRGAQEEKKGYSGFSFRFPFFPPPRDGVRIFTDRGELQTDEENHVPHAWASLEASFERKRAGVRVESGPKNPGAPHEWCLRKYGVLDPTFPGVEAHRIDPGKPLILRYAVTVYDISQP